jgi:branched-chain amino acid transport system substrate-binding protein
MAPSRSNSLRLPLLCALAVAALFVAACGSRDDSTGASSSSGGGGGGAKTLKLGMVWSMSGDFAPYGQPGVDGVKMAIADINNDGGVKVGNTTYKLDLKVVDDRSDAQAAVAGATGLLRDDKVKYILGPISGLTPPVAKLAAASNVIHLSAASVASSLAGTKDYPLLFGTLVTPEGRCEVQAKSIKEFFPKVKTAAIVGPNDPTGQLDFPICEQKFKAEGLTPTLFRYPPGTKDLTVTMTKVAASKPDIIVTGWSANDAADMFPAIADSGIPTDVPVVLFGASYTAGKDGLKDGRPFIANPFVVSDFTVPNPTQEAIAFRDRAQQFLKTQQLDPLATTMEFFYDAVRHLAVAMEKAGTVDDTAKVAQAMNSTESPGIADTIKFVHNNISTGVDATLSQGDETTTKHIVPTG